MAGSRRVAHESASWLRIFRACVVARWSCSEGDAALAARAFKVAETAASEPADATEKAELLVNAAGCYLSEL